MPTCKRRFPAEWEPQWAVQLVWPHEHSDWQNLSQVEHTYVEITRAITGFQTAIIVCYDQNHLAAVKQRLSQQALPLDKIVFSIAPSNDTWVRDTAPLGVYQDGRALLLDFQFNGWGNKYDASLDNALNRAVKQYGSYNDYAMQTVDWVLEGGSIDSNGAGLLLTTTHCLLSPERNPQWSQAQIETHLKDTLGVNEILWLEHGQLLGDDTDGHIDTLARFADANTIFYTQCRDRNDPHYQELSLMEQELKAIAQNHRLSLQPLPLPSPCLDNNGRRLAATYANFLFINNAILLPVYGLATDEEAIACFEKHFPGKKVIAINCHELILQNGSLHCATMQIPAQTETF